MLTEEMKKELDELLNDILLSEWSVKYQTKLEKWFSLKLEEAEYQKVKKILLWSTRYMKSSEDSNKLYEYLGKLLTHSNERKNI